MTESIDRCECGGLFVGGQCCDCGSIHPEDRLRGVEPPMTAVVTGDGVVPLFTGAHGGKVSVADGAIERGLAILALQEEAAKGEPAIILSDSAAAAYVDAERVHEPDPLVKAGLIAPPTIDPPSDLKTVSLGMRYGKGMDVKAVETPVKPITVKTWAPEELADVEFLARSSGSPRRRQGAIVKLVTQIRHLQLVWAKTMRERDEARAMVVAIVEKLGGQAALHKLMGEPAPTEPSPPDPAEGDHGVL